jgi:hypothetical protein
VAATPAAGICRATVLERRSRYKPVRAPTIGGVAAGGTVWADTTPGAAANPPTAAVTIGATLAGAGTAVGA